MNYLKNGTLIVGSPGSFMRRMCEYVDENIGLKRQLFNLVKVCEDATIEPMAVPLYGMRFEIKKIKAELTFPEDRNETMAMIEAAENANLEWTVNHTMVDGKKQYQVLLADDNREYFLTVQMATTLREAFANALTSVGVIKS